MNFLPGKSIDPEVVKQLETRQRVFGAKDGFDRQAYIEYQKAVPWVKLSSGVRVDLSDKDLRKAPYVSPEETGKTIGYSSYLAENNVLFNFLDQGENLLPGYESTQLGHRPLPGITGMEIYSHNRFGSLRTATVRFQCWSVEQLNRLEMLYMRPGYSLLLEWGRSAYISTAARDKVEIGSIVKTVDFFSKYKAGSVDNASRLTNEIIGLKKTYNYNYDAIYGLIKNFTWSLRTDGGYDCITSVVSTGDMIESYKANLYLSQSEVRKDLEKAAEDVSKALPTGVTQFGIDIDYFSERDRLLAPEANFVTIKAQMDSLASEINGHIASITPLLEEDNQEYGDKIRVVGPGTEYGVLIKNSYRVAQSQGDGAAGAPKGSKVPYAKTANIPSGQVEEPLTNLPFSLVKPFANNGQFQFAVPIFIRDASLKDIGVNYYDHWEDIEKTREVLEDLVDKSNGTLTLVQSPNGFVQKSGSGAAASVFNERDLGLHYDELLSANDPNGRRLQVGFIGKEVRYNFFILGYSKTTSTNTTSNAPAEPSVSLVDERYLSRLHYILNVKVKEPIKAQYFSSTTPIDGDFKAAFRYYDLAGTTSIYDLLDARGDTAFANMYETLLAGTLTEIGNTEFKDTTLIYVKLGFLLAILNKYILRDKNDTTGFPLFSFVDRPVGGQTPKYFTFTNHLSVDPTICIFPHTLQYFGVQTAGGTKLPNAILDIEVNLDYVLGVLTNNLGDNGKITLLSFLETILSDIKRVSGGVNELQVQYDEDTRAFAIVDRRLLHKSVLQEVSIFGVDSIVKNVNLVSNITPKMSSMIAISAQSNPFNSTEEATGFAALNRGLVDSVYTERADILANRGRNIQTPEEKAKAIETLEDDITGVMQVLKGFFVDRKIVSDVLDQIPAHYENYLKYILGIQNSPAFNFIIPFELQLTLDGIAGIRIMEAFKINQNILPYTYGGKPDSPIGFLVTGMQHTVDKSGWNTVVKSQIYDTSDNVIEDQGLKLNILEVVTLNIEEVRKKSKYPELEYLDTPNSTTLTYLEAVTYLKNSHRGVAKAVFAVMWAEASKTGNSFKGIEHNYAGVQTDSGRWGSSDRYFAAQHIARDSKGYRVFASFSDSASFLDFMADRVRSKGFSGDNADAWTATYIDKWWSPSDKAQFTKGTEKYNAKLAIFNTAAKKFDELAKL